MDDLNPQRLTDLLAEASLGHPFHHHTLTESTHTEAVRLARQGAPHGTLVIAEAQTKGQGRMGRSWDGGRGQSLLLSLVLRENLRPDRLGLIGGATAVALARTHDGLGVSARTKWPNDVRIGGKKVAGILIEALWTGDRLDALAVGIGWNVNQDESQLPSVVRTPATSLRIETGRIWDRGILLRELLNQLAQSLESTTVDVTTLLKEWESREATLGHGVEIRSETRTLRGTVKGIHPDGSLSLWEERGAEFKVEWGEASLLPLAG